MAKENCIRLVKHYRSIGREDLAKDVEQSYFKTYGVALVTTVEETKAKK